MDDDVKVGSIYVGMMCHRNAVNWKKECCSVQVIKVR
jgi:hypothetical protein